MIKSNRRIELERRQEIGRRRGLASGVVWRERRRTREVEADTLRWRALHDAKGQLLREGCTYRADSETHWQLRRSTAGRVNQVDLVVNSVVWRTGCLRDAERAIRRSKWPTPRRRSTPLLLDAA
jgi:hypothetical protein